MNRREFLGAAAAATQAAQAQGSKKKIACLSSTYHVRSHSDNFITRFLEGYWIHERYYAAIPGGLALDGPGASWRHRRTARASAWREEGKFNR